MVELKEIKVSEVIFRKDLYPRAEADTKLIAQYAEVIDLLPPIEVNQDYILIDGFHRLSAHKQEKKATIKIFITKTKSEEELFLMSIEKNAAHGMQMSAKDKKIAALRLFTADEEHNKRVFKSLAVSERTWREWTSKKQEELKDQRDERILDLYLKAENTQEMVADQLGIPRETARDVINKAKEELEENGENGISAESAKNFSPFIYKIWNVNGKEAGESKYFGKFLDVFMDNLLYYETEPFEVVYDPFGGSGTTIDSCKKFMRRYYVNDLVLDEVKTQKGIYQHDITTGLPDALPKPDFVFLDPPYWSQAKDQYSDHKSELGKKTLKDYYAIFESMAKQLGKRMTKGGKVAFVIQPTEYNNDFIFEDHAYELMKIFEKAGFKVKNRRILPYSTEQYNAQMVNKAKETHNDLVLHRDLVVMVKE